MLWVGVLYVSLNSSGARLYKNLQMWFDMYRTGYRTWYIRCDGGNSD